MENAASNNEKSNVSKKRCKCYNPDSSKNDCRENSACLSRHGCFAHANIKQDNWERHIRYGCIKSPRFQLIFCHRQSIFPELHYCCTGGDLCNAEIDFGQTVNEMHKKMFDNDSVPKELQIDVQWHSSWIYILPIFILLSIFFLFTIISTILFRHRVKHRMKRQKNNLPKIKNEEDDANFSIITTSGSGKGVPLLEKRTVAQDITLCRCIGRGRFGEVWQGLLYEERVAVKIFSTLDEASWARETRIYNTILLRHDNILGYYASDMVSTDDGCTQLWLITQNHSFGSLYEFLQQHVLTPRSALKILISTVSGLWHLHTEICGLQGKPSIAHRDIKSKNILVKDNGTCCIADMGLAVIQKDSSNGAWSKDPLGECPNHKVGTKRYMAPEMLERICRCYNDERVSLHAKNEVYQELEIDFTALLSADIYAFALVMWEVLRRTMLNDEYNEYQIPFGEYVPVDPSYYQMFEVVCQRKIRPEIPQRFLNSGIPEIEKLQQLICDCWRQSAESRLSSLCLKKSLQRCFQTLPFTLQALDNTLPSQAQARLPELTKLFHFYSNDQYDFIRI